MAHPLTIAARLPLAASVAVLTIAGMCASVAQTAGARWPADDVLRGGMAAIRKATLDNHTLVTHRRMPPASARRFSETIAGEAGRIDAGADVPAAARPVLEALLADIVAGAEAVAGRDGASTPIDGILRIDAALARYPLHFEDPTWQPLR